MSINDAFVCPAVYVDIGSFCIQSDPDDSGNKKTYHSALDACIARGATLPSYAQFYEAAQILPSNDNWLSDVVYNTAMRGTKSKISTPETIEVEFFATVLQYRCVVMK